MFEIAIKGLGRTFRSGVTEIQAVKNLDLKVKAGSFTAVVGESGCGKTTLLRIIAGLEKQDAGEVVFLSPPGAVGGTPRFGFMFQDARLLPWLTVEANLKLAFPPKDPESDAEIRRTLHLVGLGDWRTSYPRKLSGGMAQRAALARALCRKPDILLLDEPFGALDAITRGRLRKDLDHIWRKIGITVLFVTHDIEEAVYLSDRVVIMKTGSIRREFPVPLEHPKDYRSDKFQTLCRHIEDAM